MSTYSEKLKNPRWQKLRLFVYSRDEFKCRICGDDQSTLHAHHIMYRKGFKPWEYNDKEIITLCEEHHKMAHLNEIDYFGARQPVAVVDEGFICPFDFIQAYPSAIIAFNYIENHKGTWFLKSKTDDISCKINTISNLAYYIQSVDCNIYIDSSSEDMFYVVNKTGNVTWGQ